MGFGDLFRKMGDGIDDLFGEEKHSHTHIGHGCHDDDSHADYAHNRYCSFAPQSSGHPKWYVDGASYFWAVSIALEEARDYIYILDWWLSPELYLRRPPAKNEQYRLDRMLQAAAERGVKINVIVYKEVTQALTLDSAHTKHALEALHPNIKVFRHPDHVPRGNEILSGLVSGFQNLRTADIAKVSGDTLKALYGGTDDMVLFWAHHEKLCLIDGRIAFMGGLDMCFGRYDTNSHPIADAHPGNLDDIIFPGQDYNNARVFDFEDVQKWENNKLDRTKNSRMGWSDISISLSGPIVDSLAIHFVDRWNYIFDDKYTNRDVGKYLRLEKPTHGGPSQGLLGEDEDLFGGLHHHFSKGFHRLVGDEEEEPERPFGPNDGAHIQLLRRQDTPSSEWSAGLKTEHSIANAYIQIITQAKHFVYIENQFFITATSDAQRPVTNKIGRAIVDRIVRAHQSREDFQVIVLMPAVPAFAGDLQGEGALGTRAIMEFQYNSICRGGHSILETLVRSGVPEPSRYINFYNLRTYDRIAAVAPAVEAASGVAYEDARRDYDTTYAAASPSGAAGSEYTAYQSAASSHPLSTSWASVAACTTLSGPPLPSVPWTGPPSAELDAFVSEQLYIHSKVLIADDQIVLIGSANLNDRSQLGNHDSEIAVVIEDPTPIRTTMAGRPYTASAFASSLRRQLYRRHLGLLPHQPADRPDANWTPAEPNAYDWGTAPDRLVADPLSQDFLTLWHATATRNTEIFHRAFHPVPNDAVRTWAEYDAFFTNVFVAPGTEAKLAEEGYEKGKVDYGHVVRSEFPGGVEELKDWLGGVRGSLVEMPLRFLEGVGDIAVEGVALNRVTQELYT